MTEANVPTRYLSVSDFAEATTLSPRYVRRLLDRGSVPSIRVGRRVLIPLEAGLRALESLAPVTPGPGEVATLADA